MHLLFNLLALYFFSAGVESLLGTVQFVLIYFGADIGGNLLALFIHRHDSGYSAAGASGAIFGVIFAAIALIPGMSIGLFLLPVSIPGWLFGLIYVGVSFYGIRSRTSNIGHDAHLGGGMAGMLLAILLHPIALINNYVTILIIAVPAIAFIAFIIYNPAALFVDNVFFRNTHNLTIDDKSNLSRKEKQQQIQEFI